jgi:hypothetical protein
MVQSRDEKINNVEDITSQSNRIEDTSKEMLIKIKWKEIKSNG